MTQPLPPIPEDVLTGDLAEGAARLRVATAIYPLDAVYAAAFAFLDRCWLVIDQVEDHYLVTLAPKPNEGEAPDEETLAAMAGEFANELLAAAWRQRLTTSNRATIELVTQTAFMGAAGPPSLDELEEFDFSEEPFEDPLGIAESWEERYGKKAKKDAAPEGESE